MTSTRLTWERMLMSFVIGGNLAIQSLLALIYYKGCFKFLLPRKHKLEDPPLRLAYDFVEHITSYFHM